MHLESIPVYDYNLLPFDAITGWSSVIWTERYQEIGDFEIRIPDKNPNIDQYRSRYLDKFMKIPYSDETMVIEEITYEGGRDDSAVYLRGRDVKSIFERRVLYTNQVIPYAPSTRETVMEIFRTEIENPENPKRRIPQIALDNPSSWEVYHLDYDSEEKNVWDIYLHCARIYRCGFRSYWSGGKIRFVFWRPFLKTGESDSFPVVFSEQYGTLTNIIYRRSAKTYKTTAYVHEVSSKNGYSIDIEVSNRFADGLNRRETWVHADTPAPLGPADEVTRAGYLRPKGVDALYDHALYDQITGNVPRNDLYTYGWGKDYFLGDTVLVASGGSTLKAQVKEFTYAWTIEGGSVCYPTLEATPVIDTLL